jgi:hypothetical protein
VLVSREVFHVEHSSASLHRCAIQRPQIREVFHVEHPLQTTGPSEGPIRGCSTWNSRRLVGNRVGRYPKVIYFNEIIADDFCTKIRHCHRTSFRSIVKTLSVLYNLKWDVL